MQRTIKLAPSKSGSKAPAAVAVVAFEGGRGVPKAYADLERLTRGALGAVLARPESKAARGSVQTIYPPPRKNVPERVFVLGLGKPDDVANGGLPEALRLAAAKLARAAAAAKVKRVTLRTLGVIGERMSHEQIGHAIADGLAIASLELDAFKGSVTRDGDADRGARNADLAVEVEPELREHVAWGLTVGQGVATARRLAATPPNVANPDYIVDQCRSLAEEVGLACDVIDVERMRELGMGGLLAVGGGGSHDPALIVLEWNGGAERGSRNDKPLLLVGKAITFDTGGYSLKPAASMTGMKYDKCGGMAVIGAMEAIARLELPRRVVALIPCAENMIDDDAYRVDDILTFCNGVTSEVTNTDAEGRLVLADALAYGTKTYDPAAVIDLATLTGGVRVALGVYCAGLFCNDEPLRARVEAAGAHTGERVWQLPLWPEHRDLMKGNHADLVNSSADRQAHSIQGAAFLSFFVGDEAPKKMPTLPWAHLDIAATAATDGDHPLYGKGPTGWGVRLLARLVAGWAD